MRRWAQTGAMLLGAAVGVYAGWAAMAFVRYGRVAGRDPAERDELLDRFIPVYEVYDRHEIQVNAPAATTLDAAREQDMLDAPLIRAIFNTRALVMGSKQSHTPTPRGLLASTLSFGWRVLEEVPGREVVVGAVTRPWEADVVFRGIAPEAFASFAEPDYVKIVWTLRADPLAGGGSLFSTETRVIATDAGARRKFRRYWALASPGISTIRRLGLPAMKRQAERVSPPSPSPPLSGQPRPAAP